MWYFGFTGNVDKGIDRAHLALNSLGHRGPDQSGEFKDNNVFLGHRRLSIIDLSVAGKQPMTSLEHHVTITVNGEIYNYKSLRSELISNLISRVTATRKLCYLALLSGALKDCLKELMVCMPL